MKKKTTVTLIVLLILLTLLPQIYAYIYPPHINPETAPEEKSPPISILLTYALDNLTAQNFTETLKLINNTNHIYVPQNYKYILTRTTELLRQLTDTLKQINETLNETKTLIEYGKLKDAKTKLNETELLLKNANYTLKEVEDAVNQLIQTFKLPSNPLKEKIDETKNILNQYTQTYLNLKQTIDEIISKIKQGTLIQPNLTISANATKTPVGSTIKIYGNLTASNKTLPNKTITIYINEQPYKATETNENGIFEINLELPLIYISTIKIYATYKPEGQDAEQYIPTTSNTIQVTLIYQTPTITILSSPEKIKPAAKNIIKGKIELNNTPLPNWPLNITINHNTTTIYTDNQGYFNYTIKITKEPSTPIINIIIKTQPQKSIGPATTKITLPIEYIDSKITVKTPKIIITGIKFKIQGTAETQDGPIRNAIITIKIGSKIITTNTNENGTFTAEIVLPLSTLSRKTTVTILLTPKDFWIKTKTVEIQVTIINPLTIIAPLMLILIPVTNTLKTKRKEEAKVVIEKEIIETITPTAVRKEEIKAKHPIVALYWETVKKIHSKIGVYPQPSQTLREYLSQIKERIKNIAEKFEKLTILTEKALYAEKTTKQDEKLAKELYKNIIEELKQ